MSDDSRRRGAALLACIAICCASLLAPAGASAATLTVTTTADELDPPGSQSGACSLREAVFAIDQGFNYDGGTPDCVATGAAYGSQDTIVLGSQTYELTRPPVSLNPDDNVDGDLDLVEPLTIDGTGAGPGGTVIDANGNDRVLDLLSAPVHTVVTVQDLTITGGDTTVSGDAGGAIRIGDTDAEFTVQDAALRDNESGNDGGAIAFPNALSSAVLEIDGSELSGNTAASQGGAVWFGTTSPGEMVITYSALVGNHAARGGALYVAGFPSTSAAELQNTTVSGNSASHSGGGIELGEGPVRLELAFSTIAQNTATQASARGGGIRIVTGASPTVIESDSSIFAGNTAAGAPSNCGGEFTLADQGFNIDSGVDCNFNSGSPTFDLVETDPLLAPVGLYGGPSPVHGLYDGSPALDLADCGGSSGFDQRFVARPSKFPGTPGCDTGAFEGSVGPVPTVPTTASPPTAVAPGTTAAIARANCKKGRKLKKGKCVKKKRKRARGRR